MTGLLPNRPNTRQNRTVTEKTVTMAPAHPAEDLPTCLIQAHELQGQTRPVSESILTRELPRTSGKYQPNRNSFSRENRVCCNVALLRREI
jgi:hypothetical protein